MNNEQRTNATLRSVVELGIRLSEAQGCANGWAYMQAYGVPKAAIARVLAFPHARRRHHYMLTGRLPGSACLHIDHQMLVLSWIRKCVRLFQYNKLHEIASRTP